MYLSVELRYPAPMADVAAMLADSAAWQWRSDHSTSGGRATVDASGVPADRFTVAIRRTVSSDLIPTPVRGVVGGSLEVRRTEVWEHTESGPRGTVSVEIVGAPVRMSGTVALHVEGTTCVQTYNGDVISTIPLFGSTIEEAASAEVLSALRSEEASGIRWLELSTHAAS